MDILKTGREVDTETLTEASHKYGNNIICLTMEDWADRQQDDHKQIVLGYIKNRPDSGMPDHTEDA